MLPTSFEERPVASTSARPALSDAQIEEANQLLADAEPQAILEWAVQHVPNLYQTTAFGLTGLAATDMLSKISAKFAAPGSPPKHLVPLIFIDTLYHFPETLALADQVSRKYGVKLHVYTPPKVSTTQEFEAEYGRELWKTDEESYDYLVKVSQSALAQILIFYNLLIAASRLHRLRKHTKSWMSQPFSQAGDGHKAVIELLCRSLKSLRTVCSRSTLWQIGLSSKRNPTLMQTECRITHCSTKATRV